MQTRKNLQGGENTTLPASSPPILDEQDREGRIPVAGLVIFLGGSDVSRALARRSPEDVRGGGVQLPPAPGLGTQVAASVRPHERLLAC